MYLLPYILKPWYLCRETILLSSLSYGNRSPMSVWLKRKISVLHHVFKLWAKWFIISYGIEFWSYSFLKLKLYWKKHYRKNVTLRLQRDIKVSEFKILWLRFLMVSWCYEHLLVIINIIWGSNDSEYEDGCLLGCNAVLTGISLLFQRSVRASPWWQRQYRPLKRW
jgi:hypothetical protein